ncbi:uncharacterized protein LOC130825491 [Amaranthus tricolor]|uniref:uncharacterized protein LOC130825491 n=1 Tax=Amaranthus tricolor TaxID=29722 RepID=UPI002589E4CE|nr:uncharacterized protein LOC130825491 [Amaranthus tricolor]
MSRCFPFPPPGYERKTKADDSDLLKKEKNKEKRSKKEKKDKEKKEGKEKREKERSDDKHREKKDKKEKNKDKRKDKEKDRDKDKHKSNPPLSDEKVLGSADSHIYKISDKSKKEIEKIPSSIEKRVSGVSAIQNGMLVGKNNHHVSGIRSPKFIAEMGRKSMDEDRRTNNHFPPDKNVVAERKNYAGVNLASRSGISSQKLKERIKEKPTFDGRIDGRGVLGDARSSESPLVPHSVRLVLNSVGSVSNSGMVQRLEGTPKPVDKKIEQKVEGKEKVREKEGDDRKGDRRKERERDKDKKREQIMKATPEDKRVQVTRMKHESENHILTPGLKDGNKKDILGVPSVGFHNVTKDSNHHAAIVNSNHRKRKDPGLNGIYDEHVIGPNKHARTIASPHLLTENGRSLEPCHNSSAAVAPGTQLPPMNIKVGRNLSHDDVLRKPMNIEAEHNFIHEDVLRKPMNIEVEHNLSHDDAQRPRMKIKVDGKECKINGTVADPSTKPSRETTAKVERKPEKPPPHPDTKYLSQVLSVPKMEELSNSDNEEWLFNSSSSLTRKPEAEPSGIDETPQVWARALWLEPVDIYALPYVIPH